MRSIKINMERKADSEVWTYHVLLEREETVKVLLIG